MPPLLAAGHCLRGTCASGTLLNISRYRESRTINRGYLGNRGSTGSDLYRWKEKTQESKRVCRNGERGSGAPGKISQDFSRSDRSGILSGKRYWPKRREQLSMLRVPGQWHGQPDARASTLDLSVLRSSRIARNSSYFVLIRKFVPVQLPRFRPPFQLPSAISFPVSSAAAFGKLVSPRSRSRLTRFALKSHSSVGILPTIYRLSRRNARRRKLKRR